MRQDLASFNAANESEVSQPIVVVELSVTSDNSEVIYISSHQVDDLPVGDVYQNAITKCSSTSQKLRIQDYSSTIGAINAEVADDGNLSNYLRTKFDEDKTTSDNRFRLYAGFAGLPFSDFSVVQTQAVQDITYDDGEIKFQCRDIQRTTKKNIFDAKSTTLTQNLAATDTTINVQNTSGFQAVWHGSSYSDSPNSKVLYLILRDGDDYEIIRVPNGNITGTTFTGVTRGAMGTIPRAWEALDSDGESNELEVEEFIYIELPVVKLVYAILTGNLYGDTGEGFPDHWNLDINEQWINTAKFTNIGTDIWDVNDDSAGRIALFKGIQKEEGRKFINEQLMPLISCFMPISNLGELGLKRITSVLSDAPFGALLTKENIDKAYGLKYAQSEVKNRLLVEWSYDFTKEDFRRASLFYDTESKDRYSWRPEKVLELKGMHGSRHSRDFMKNTFSAFRDRFASEPIYTKLDLIPGLNVLEVGDTVRVNLEGWEDYTDSGELNRTFEVQGVRVDWLKGNVSVDLFGSTQKPGALPDDGEGYGTGFALEDSLLTSAGSNIETAFSANTSRTGDLVTLDSDITFTGNSQLTQADGTINPTCILYCDGDLTVPFGVALNFTGNMVLICTGFVTVEGAISGVGGGKSGGDGQYWSAVTEYDEPLSAGKPTRVTSVDSGFNQAESGFISPSLRPQGGIVQPYSGNARFCFGVHQVDVSGEKQDGSIDPLTEFTSVPELIVSASDLSGLPSTLEGSGGPGGIGVYTDTGLNTSAIKLGEGGSGGNGGGGLVTISRGLSFGAGGEIDLSGGDAGADNFFDYVPMGSSSAGNTQGGRAQGGSGCPGSPGAWVCLIDGGDSVPPIIDATKLKANCGAPSFKTQNVVAFYPLGDIYNYTPNTWDSPFRNDHTSDVYYDAMSPQLPTYTEVVNFWQSYHRVQFLVPAIDPPGEIEPADTVAPDVTNITLTENTNTPQTPAGDRSSIDILVSPPASTAYAYSNIYTRIQGQSVWNKLPIAAENETVHENIQSDGATREYQARAVSTTGIENTSGPIQTVTLSNKTNTTDYELEVGYDQSTETFIRVRDTSDDSIIVSLSGTGGTVGKVTAGADSSGYGNFADIPTSLSDINAAEYQSILDDIAAAELGSGIATFWQTTAPSSGMAEGDLWYDTGDGNHPYRYTSGSWLDAQDSEIAAALAAAATAQTTADGKMIVFTSGPAAPTADGVGDLWVYDGETRVWNGSAWVLGGDITSQNTSNDTSNVNGIPSSTITANVAQALADAAAAQSTADGKVTIFYDSSAPISGMDADDLWYDAGNGNEPYRYNGSAWVLVQDAGIAQALADAATAQSTADGKITVFSGGSTPTADGVGDLWDNGTIVRRWNGSAWVDFADSTQSAIDNEIITTGGLVLSTNGAVRTNGKTNVNDSNAGVFLGNNGSANVFEVGDGGDNFIRFDGSDLVLGAETRFVGVDSVHSVSKKVYPEEFAHAVSGSATSSSGQITFDQDGASVGDYGEIFSSKYPVWPASSDNKYLDSFSTLNGSRRIDVKIHVSADDPNIVCSIGHGGYQYNAAGTIRSSSGYGVYYDQSSDKLVAWVNDGFSSTAAPTTASFSSTYSSYSGTYNLLTIIYDAPNETIYFYIDGSLEATLSGYGLVYAVGADLLQARITKIGSTSAGAGINATLILGDIRVTYGEYSLLNF